MAIRSLLFTPATSARQVAKALAGDTDGVILDLEDSIAVAEKPQARLTARQTLDGVAAPDARPQIFVRVNGLTTPFAYDDLRTVVGSGLDGVIVPKTESAAQVESAMADAGAREASRYASRPASPPADWGTISRSAP